MNTAGWLLTESGRQPWVVQGIMLTKNGISPSSIFTYLVISVAIFIALYLCLAALFLVFMLRYSRRDFGRCRMGRMRLGNHRTTGRERRCSVSACD